MVIILVHLYDKIYPNASILCSPNSVCTVSQVDMCVTVFTWAVEHDHLLLMVMQ